MHVHLPLDIFSFSFVTCSASPVQRNFRVFHRLQLNAALILIWSNLNIVRCRARIENVICPRGCEPMWVRTFSKNYVIFSCQLHFDGLQQRARQRNYFVFFFFFHISLRKPKNEKWWILCLKCWSSVGLSWLYVRLIHTENVCRLVLVSTFLRPFSIMNISNFTSGFPVSTTPFRHILSIQPNSSFFVFVCFHAHCAMHANDFFFFTRNVMSQCS